MFTIDSDTINKFHSLSFDNSTEQCCFLLLDEKTNYIYLDSSSCSRGFQVSYKVDGKDKERAACNFVITSDQQKFAPFIIHSHPVTSKPYPSYEDITKIMYRPHIKASLISTSQGLWVLSSPDSKVWRYISNKFITNNKLDYTSFNREFQDRINFYLDKLYQLYISTGRKHLPANEAQSIVDALNKKLKINIQFYSWNDILGKKFYFYV